MLAIWKNGLMAMVLEYDNFVTSQMEAPLSPSGSTCQTEPDQGRNQRTASISATSGWPAFKRMLTPCWRSFWVPKTLSPPSMSFATEARVSTRAMADVWLCNEPHKILSIATVPQNVSLALMRCVGRWSLFLSLFLILYSFFAQEHNRLT